MLELFLKAQLKNFKKNKENHIIENKIIKIKPKITELNYFPKVDVNQMQVIMNQMNNSVCKIIAKSGSGTGFLCYIPFPKIINKFPILLTVNHILSGKYISKGSKINFSFGDSDNINTIIIDDSRKVFTNEELDFTIIEIKPKDKIKSEYFLQLDKNILNKDNFYGYFNCSAIYTMGYEINKNIGYSICKIEEEKENDIFFKYFTHTDQGSSGSPIMNLTNFKVLGMHIGREKKDQYKIGISLKKIVSALLKSTLTK